MVNFAAVGHQDLTGAAYGDYMDGIEPVVFNEGTDLSGVNLIK